MGSNPKRLVISPGETANEFVTPVQGHLFNGARDRQAQQLWCDVVTYALSYIVNVTVPPAYVAGDSAAGETGALIELFCLPVGAKKRAFDTRLIALSYGTSCKNRRAFEHHVRMAAMTVSPGSCDTREAGDKNA